MQINLTFKDTQKERELYIWLKSQIGMGAFIKQILYKQYLAETVQPSPSTNTAQIPTDNLQIATDTPDENMNVDFGEWGM